MVQIRIQRLEPVWDPDAHERVMRILEHGIRRGVLRLLAESGAQQGRNTPPFEEAPAAQGASPDLVT